MASSGSSPAFGSIPQPTMAIHNDIVALATSPGSRKRKLADSDETTEDIWAKRRTPPDTPSSSSSNNTHFPSSSSPSPEHAARQEHIVNIANENLGREILLRHEELRFINQELAKCQAALEQLRRCHLIPYPNTCPTPQQVLDIIDGHVPAVQLGDGLTPQWAPPYGVVDGPYARHYAKWLIPDPKFDGLVPEWSSTSEVTKTMEGRSTRNSLSAPDGATVGRRVGRGQSMHKAPATPAAPKNAKTTQYFTRQSDGAVFKLVCIGCEREDFCSVQGFINHVRISHGISYQSHQEAAKACGHIVDPGEAIAPAEEDKASAAPILPPQAKHAPAGTVHPLAAVGRQAVAQLDRNLGSSMQIFPQGRTPGVMCKSGDVSSRSSSVDGGSRSSKSFVGSSVAPTLSTVLQERGFEGDFSTYVQDAKTKILDDDLMDDDDDEDADAETDDGEPAATKFATSNGLRPPTLNRARTTQLSLDPTAARVPSVTSSTADEETSGVFDPNMMDIEHSPNTAKNPPSLVSDDSEGEEESDDGAYSDAGELHAGEEQIAEIDCEVDSEYRDDPIAEHTAGASSGTKKDDDRHVTFVSPAPGKLSKGAGRKSNV